MSEYKSRAHQLRAVERRYRAGKISLRALVRNAATIGACAERDRILKYMRHIGMSGERGAIPLALYNTICSQSILEVLNCLPKKAEAAEGGRDG